MLSVPCICPKFCLASVQYCVQLELKRARLHSLQLTMGMQVLKSPLFQWKKSVHAREPARLHMTAFVAQGSSASAQAAAPVAKPFCAASPEERAQVLKALRETGEGHHAYTCLNGHLFLVGNCGAPSVAARCPDCGASIGAGSFCPHASLS